MVDDNSSLAASKISATELKFVEEQWLSACEKMNVTQRHSTEWWLKLSERYGECHRHYHTIKHIHFMLKHLDRFCGNNVTKRLEVVLAIFFHDFIYDVKSQSNEKDSADEFRKFAAETNLEESGVVDTEFVYHMIILTESHKTIHHSPDQGFGIKDEHYLLDLDMAILGQPWNVYQAYARAVRQEYIHVPHDQYCERRAEVLSGFISSSRIYCTQLFNHEFEKAAKSNIENEINLLRRSQLP